MQKCLRVYTCQLLKSLWYTVCTSKLQCARKYDRTKSKTSLASQIQPTPARIDPRWGWLGLACETSQRLDTPTKTTRKQYRLLYRVRAIRKQPLLRRRDTESDPRRGWLGLACETKQLQGRGSSNNSAHSGMRRKKGASEKNSYPNEVVCTSGEISLKRQIAPI